MSENFTVKAYHTHFRDFGCRFYKLTEGLNIGMDDQTYFYLSEVGLPDHSVPFFYFDLHLGLMREKLPVDAAYILGTIGEPAGFDYLILGVDGVISIYLEDQTRIFVNNSLKDLVQFIYTYSLWLDNLENKPECWNESGLILPEGAMFDLYYSLRNISRSALEIGTYWNGIFSNDFKVLVKELD